MTEEFSELFTKLDRRAVSVVTGFDHRADDEWWWARTPAERLEYMEHLRRMNYGDAAAGRLQRVLEIAQRTER